MHDVAAEPTERRGWWATATCALVVAVGLVGRDGYLLGSVWYFMRWPCLLGAGLLVWRRSNRQRLVAVVALSAIVAEAAVVVLRRARPPDVEPATHVTVVTHNLLFRGADMGESLEAVRASDADVLALQETTPAWAALLDSALSHRWPHHVAFLHRGAHGLSVYSKYPLSGEVRLGPVDAPFAQCVEVTTPSRVVSLCNVHLTSPAGPLSWANRWARVPGLVANAADRAREWAVVEAELLRRPAATRIVAGDFNTMEVEPLYRDIREGWVDVFRARSWQGGATWPWRVRRVTPFVRIDYVFVRGEVVPVDAEVLARSGSDHRPVRAVVGW